MINFSFLGLSIHTFHGNFFVRSTDLLSLPNVNPDAGYAVQMSVEESLTDTHLVSFQSALLYTSSKGKLFFFNCGKKHMHEIYPLEKFLTVRTVQYCLQYCSRGKFFDLVVYSMTCDNSLFFGDTHFYETKRVFLALRALLLFLVKWRCLVFILLNRYLSRVYLVSGTEVYSDDTTVNKTKFKKYFFS